MRQRFDVMRNLEKFYKILGTKQALRAEQLDSVNIHGCGIPTMNDPRERKLQKKNGAGTVKSIHI